MDDKRLEKLGNNVNDLMRDALVLFNQIESIAQPHLARPIERHKSDFISDIHREATSTEPLTPETAAKILDLIESQATYYSRITVGPSLNFGRAAFVQQDSEFEWLVARQQLETLTSRIPSLRAHVLSWKNTEGKV